MVRGVVGRQEGGEMPMLTTWNPWQDLLEMQRELSDFSKLGTGWLAPFTWHTDGGWWTPPVDVFARNGDLVVRAELPGVDPDKDVDISYQDGLLTIRGERRKEEKTEQENYYRFESSYGSFSRSIPVPQGVRPEDVKATYENAILEVV